MTTPPANHTTWAFPTRKQKLPDGRWVIMPGEPQNRCRTAEAVKITGLPAKTLHRLADCGVIRRAQLTPNIVIWWPGEIEEVIERISKDEAFSRKLQFSANLTSKDLHPHLN